MSSGEKILGYPKLEWVIALIFGAIVFFGFKSCAGGPSESTLAKRCNDTGLAFVMSQKFVKRNLKSPSSARFPSKPYESYQAGECSIHIASSYEAQNSFGAQLSGSYKVTMSFNKSDSTWSASGLEIN